MPLTSLFLVTGEVFDYLVAHGRMKEKEARAKFRQVCMDVHLDDEVGRLHRWAQSSNRRHDPVPVHTYRVSVIRAV